MIGHCSIIVVFAHQMVKLCLHLGHLMLQVFLFIGGLLYLGIEM
jgi:hypothetical protein